MPKKQVGTKPEKNYEESVLEFTRPAVTFLSQYWFNHIFQYGIIMVLFCYTSNYGLKSLIHNTVISFRA